jgi:inward rectifier potassium channel
MERGRISKTLESRHLLERPRVGAKGNQPIASVEFIWPVNVGEYAKSVVTGLYFHLMHMRSISFFAVTLGYYLTGSFIFSGLYWAVRDEMADPSFPSYIDAFFYSGGRMVGLDGRFDAVGPRASTVALIQAFLAMLSGAVLTGLLYARFASPKSHFHFSDKIVLTSHQGRDALMFRLANNRRGMIKEVEVQVFTLVRKVGPNGQWWGSMTSLELAKSALPQMDMYPWTVIHYIDENSPFYKTEWREVLESVESVIVHAKGFDVVCNGGIYADKVYVTEKIELNRRFKDMISFDQRANGVKHQIVNYRYFHDTVPGASERFEQMAAFGGATSLMEVVSSNE